MRHLHTAAQVRALEEPLLAGLPEGTLMDRAATGLATVCAGLLGRVHGARVVLLVGTGNNGADALEAGALLRRRGADVLAVTVGPPVARSLARYRASGGRVVGPDALDDRRLAAADLVLDGLVGIGARGPLRPGPAALAARLAAARPDRTGVVAVDVPSGVDASTGDVAGEAVGAEVTVTFGAAKPGLVVGAGRDRAGRVVEVSVGLDVRPTGLAVLEPGDVAARLPVPSGPSDKYTRGVVGVAAGSPAYPGAAVLAVGAALQAGAGMVRFAGADSPAEQVRLRWPEAVVTPFPAAGRVQAWVVGPGLGTDDDAAAVVARVLAADVPVLVDADALTLCAARPGLLRDRAAPTLLTPHDREYARFGAEVGPDRVAAARRLAADLGVHVLLKGDATVVAAPDGTALVNPTGSPVLAAAGTGDVLSGGVGALLAQGLDPLDAGAVGAWLHGRAGALSADGATTTAVGVLEHWRAAVRETLRS